MSYEKQTWVNGETITEEKLNHMEDGIADNADSPVVMASCLYTTDGISDQSHTYSELVSAVAAKKVVILAMYTMPPEYGLQVEYLHLVYCYDTTGTIVFSEVPSALYTTSKVNTIEINSQNTWTRSLRDITFSS